MSKPNLKRVFIKTSVPVPIPNTAVTLMSQVAAFRNYKSISLRKAAFFITPVDAILRFSHAVVAVFLIEFNSMFNIGVNSRGTNCIPVTKLGLWSSGIGYHTVKRC